MQNYTGERRVPQSDLRVRLDCGPTGTYGQVIRSVSEQWGREGDTWNPLRMVTVDKVVATTERFPAYHTDGAWKAAIELGARTAGQAYAPFAGWNSVLAHATQGKPLYYQAPLDSRPVLVRIVKVYKNGKVRIDPLCSDADKFTADFEHADRFRYAL